MKVVAKALVVDNKGNILVLYRGLTHPHFPGHLDMPGGEVEENEAWDTAVAREIAEEAGIAVAAERLEKIFELKHPNVIHVLYTAKIDTERPDVTLSWEHSGFKWLPVQELQSLPLPEGVDRYYADVIDHISSHSVHL